METLRLDIDHALRAFRLALALEVGAETVALVGPSGAGKSSVLRIVAGLLRPERGVVTLGGETWLDRTAGVDLPPDRRRVGLVFQEYALFPHLDVRGNVAFGARDPGVVPELLERLRIVEPRAGEAERDLGRRAPAGRARAGARTRAGRAAPRRAPVGARHAHARAPCGRSCTSCSRLRPPDAARDARLRGCGDARRPRRRPRRGLDPPGRDRAAARRGARGRLRRELHRGEPASRRGAPRPERTDRGRPRRGRDGLDDRAGSGRVSLAVYPWEISLSRETPDDSAVNHIRAPVASVVALGNRVRVRVGPVTAEVTAASAGPARSARGGGRRRVLQGDGCAAPARRVASRRGARVSTLRSPSPSCPRSVARSTRRRRDPRSASRPSEARGRARPRSRRPTVSRRTESYAPSPRSTRGATRA